MSDADDRIRAHAYRIWQEEGRPAGHEARHWDMARQLVAIEGGGDQALKPNPLSRPEAAGEPVEPIEALENQGEFPTLTDQGEQAAPKRRRAPAAKAAAAPAPRRRSKPGEAG